MTHIPNMFPLLAIVASIGLLITFINAFLSYWSSKLDRLTREAEAQIKELKKLEALIERKMESFRILKEEQKYIPTITEPYKVPDDLIKQIDRSIQITRERTEAARLAREQNAHHRRGSDARTPQAPHYIKENENS